MNQHVIIPITVILFCSALWGAVISSRYTDMPWKPSTSNLDSSRQKESFNVSTGTTKITPKIEEKKAKFEPVTKKTNIQHENTTVLKDVIKKNNTMTLTNKQPALSIFDLL